MMNIANEHKFTFIPVGGLSNIFFDFPPQPECNVRIKSRIWGCICAFAQFAQFAPLAPIAWLVPSPASPFYFPDFQRLHFQRPDFQRSEFQRPLHKEPTCSHQILPRRLLNIAKNLSMPLFANCTKIPFTICHHQQWNELQDTDYRYQITIVFNSTSSH